MSALIPVIIDGETIFVEVEESAPSRGEAAVEKGISQAALNAFNRARSTIVTAAKGLYETVHSLDQAITPDEFSFQFAIKFNAEGQAFLASASAEASITVTMTYKHQKGN